MAKGAYKSVYLPAEVAAKLKEHPEINFSRVCRAAIEDALDKTGADGLNVGTVMKELREREAEVDRLKKVMQGILRHAAGFCDMTILDDKEGKIFREVFEDGTVTGFTRKIRRQVLEEQRAKRRRRRQKSAKKRKDQAARITVEQTETAAPAALATGEAQVATVELPAVSDPICSICQQSTGDVPCEREGCTNMICWFCWGDLADGAKLCPSCSKEELHGE